MAIPFVNNVNPNELPEVINALINQVNNLTLSGGGGSSIGPSPAALSYFLANPPSSVGLRSGITDSVYAADTAGSSSTGFGQAIAGMTGGASGTAANFVPIFSTYMGGALTWAIG